MNTRLLLCLAAVFAALTFTVHAATVPCWSVHEIALTATGKYANAYTDVEVTAVFTGPDGAVKTVRGFWDGGKDFKVRFTPAVQGEWRYVVSAAPADPGLAQSGAFTCTAPTPGSHGFLRRDTAFPASFVFDDGTRHFACGTTYYGILANARAGDRWREAIEGVRRYGMNKVRFSLAPSSGGERGGGYPRTRPFVNEDNEELDLEHWRTTDRVIAHLAERGFIADVILFWRKGKETPGMRARDDRYLRYALARYAAAPNVLWCLVNEWNYSELPRESWSHYGRLMRAEDPWSSAAPPLGQRGLSIHQQTRPDWNFTDEDWYSHAILQLGVRNRGTSEKVGNEWQPAPNGVKRFPFGDDWGNHSIVRNWTGKYPVVNDEYGYIGEPKDDTAGDQRGQKDVRFTREKHRRSMWGIAIGGGYLAAGDKNNYGADGAPYFSANWRDTPEYGDVKRLVDFFTTRGVEYWKMAPRNDLVKGQRAYALAEPGRQYVLYAAVGGEFAADLAPGTYLTQRFDPRTGEAVDLPPTQGGTQTFTLPDAQDWVIRLRARKD